MTENHTLASQGNDREETNNSDEIDVGKEEDLLSKVGSKKKKKLLTVNGVDLKVAAAARSAKE